MLCAHDPDLAIFVAPALQARSRVAEAEPLLTCAEQKLMREQRRPYFARQRSRAIVHFARANIHALRGDNTAAASELDRAVAAKWRGQYAFSSSLDDYPAFDRLRGDARFLKAKARLQQELAREREALLAS